MEDWRLNGQEAYLLGAKLKKTRFEAEGYYDHVHCDFCWGKISEYDGDLHVGYCTEGEIHWVCEECYNDFKDMFHFELEPSLI